jgi:AcrR family transcriptional regulator
MADINEKQRIIEVAAKRFLELGISKVTLDEIASDLGMSKKTMYKFFPSKEDLLATIVHSMMSNNSICIEGIIGSDKPFMQKANELFAFLGRQIGTISKQFIIDLQRFSPSLWKELEEFRRQRILSNMRLMFLLAKDEGIFRKEIDVELFILIFVHAVQGIVSPQTLAEQSFSTEEALQGIFKILFEGAMTDEARNKFTVNDKSVVPNSLKR